MFLVVLFVNFSVIFGELEGSVIYALQGGSKSVQSVSIEQHSITALHTSL